MTRYQIFIFSENKMLSSILKFHQPLRCLRILRGRKHLLIVRAFASAEDEKKAKELGIDLDTISRKIEEDLAKAKAGEETESDKKFKNLRKSSPTSSMRSEADAFSVIMSWKYVGFIFTLLGSMLTVLLILWKIRSDEKEVNRKRQIGRAKIGGEWELLNMEGKPEGSKDLLGKWVLIYFGFTNCPDICPDEIEKLVDVVDTLHREDADVQILPIFISVDPERDTVERVKKYCAEFSPKLRGYTGDKEQVNKVAKAFRIYHSEGPRSAQNKDDYIVDHTVMMYLVNPDGQFTDYYGQNRRAREIATVIRSKALMWQIEKQKEQSILRRILGRKESSKNSDESPKAQQAETKVVS